MSLFLYISQSFDTGCQKVMTYNLTENQKELMRRIVAAIRAGELQETFLVMNIDQSIALCRESDRGPVIVHKVPGDITVMSILERDGLINIDAIRKAGALKCTVAGSAYQAVDSEFRDEAGTRPISELAQQHPPEISMSLDRLRQKYPDPKKLGFLVMRFTGTKPFSEIVQAIKATGEKHGLTIVRADDQEFHADLLGNVRTYLHGCGFGIAVYERIETNDPNANVGLEVGYFLAMNKPVLLLKDETLPSIQSDLAGKLYKEFDPHDPEGTIPPVMDKWLQDYGIVVPGAASKTA